MDGSDSGANTLIFHPTTNPNNTLKPGTYQAVADPIFGKLGESPNTGTPFIEVMLTIEDTGEAIPWRGYLSQAAAKHSVPAMMKCFGWDGNPEKLACGPGHDGRCMVQVGEKAGKKFIEAEFINPISIGMDEGKRKSLASSLKDLCKEASAGVVIPKPVGRTGAERLKNPGMGLDDTDDEIKF